MPCENWSYFSTSQGTTRSQERHRTDPSQSLQRKRAPANNLNSDFQPPDVCKTISKFQFVELCYGSPMKLSIQSMMASNHLMLCHPLLLLPSTFHSIRVFSKESVLFRIREPKYWSFSISPFNEYSGLISFMIDRFDLVVQGTLKSLLQHHSSKASILWHSAFFLWSNYHICT